MWNAASRQFFLNQAKPYPYATGGDYVYLYEDTATGKTYRVHEFLSTGTSTLNVEVGGEMDILVVGGGGGGGGSCDGGPGGGGGAGGFLLLENKIISPNNYSISVGAGGTGGVKSCTGSRGKSGTNSLFDSFEAIGGGGGGGSGYGSNDNIGGGRNGGSGGGGGSNPNSSIRSAGNGTSGQGNAGGAGNWVNDFINDISGGGGGAGQTGYSGTDGRGGNGRDFLNRYFSGGGGGAGRNSNQGKSGGLGGGGNGGNGTNGVDGYPNTGGGGGAGSGWGSGGAGGNGGSGIVIVRYVIAEKKLWTPSELSDLSVWLDANDTSFSNNDAVSTWTNKGSGNDTTQSDSSKRPIFKTNLLNGKPGVQFDGSNDCLQITSLPLNTYISVFVVAKTTTSNPFFVEHSVNAVTNNNGFWFYGKGGVNNAFYRVERNGLENAYLGVTDWFGSNAAQASLIINSIPSSGSPMGVVYKNGTSQDSITPAGATTYDAISNSSYTDTLNIGARNDGASVPTDGDWHELIIYNTALSTTDRQKLEGYLAHKWGLTNNLPSGHPYKYEPPYKVEPEEIVTDGLVLNLDAGDYASYPRSGTTWYDISGNGNHATLNGTYTFDVDEGSIEFSNSSTTPTSNVSYIKAASISNMRTFSFWFYRNAIGGTTWRYFLDGRPTVNNSWIISGGIGGFWTNSTLYLNGTAQTFSWANIEPSSLDEWRNVTIISPSSLSTALYIFARYSGDEAFPGTIGNIQIYNRALSSTEIQQNFNALRGRYGI